MSYLINNNGKRYLEENCHTVVNEPPSKKSRVLPLVIVGERTHQQGMNILQNRLVPPTVSPNNKFVNTPIIITSSSQSYSSSSRSSSSSLDSNSEDDDAVDVALGALCNLSQNRSNLKNLRKILPEDDQSEKSVSDESPSQEELKGDLEEALNAISSSEGRNPNPLLELFKTERLKTLSTHSKEDIFNHVLESEHVECMIESIKLGVCKSSRDDALHHALDIQSFLLAKAAIEGADGQKPLNFYKWSRCTPLVTIQCLQSLGCDPALTSYLCSLSSLDQSDLEEAEWRQLLANQWELDQGEFEIKGEQIEYAGAFVHLFIDRILTSLKSFQEQFPSMLGEELFSVFFNLVDGSRMEISVEEKLKKYQSGQWIMLHGGYPQHHLDVCFCNGSLLICDKSGMFENPVQVYTIAPELVTAELFKTIISSFSEFNRKQAKEFFTTTLPQQLNDKNHSNFNSTLTDLLTENWLVNAVQWKDNCVWESLRTGISATLGMYVMLNLRQEENTREQVNQEIKTVLKRVSAWECYFILWGVEAYLDYSSKDPSRVDRVLLEWIFKEARTMREESRRLGGNLDSIWKDNKVEQLEERYQSLIETADASLKSAATI